MHPFSLRIVFLVFAIGSLFLSARWSHQGFDQIQDFKRLERLVPSHIMGLLPGENQIVGFAANLPGHALLSSPKTQTPSLYYRYLLEKEERDSDGDTHWVTVKDQQRALDFELYDHSGAARVNAEKALDDIRWLMKPRFKETNGSYRYTEWRIEPQDKLTLYAWVLVNQHQSDKPDFTLSFSQQGAYLPIISTYSNAQIRAMIGEDATIDIWLGISVLTLAVVCLVYVVQIHRILVFLTFLSMLTMISLGSLGFTSLKQDVVEGIDRFEKRFTETRTELSVLGVENLEEKLAHKIALSWQELRAYLLLTNIQSLKLVQQYQTNYFPESWMAWWLDANDHELPKDMTLADFIPMSELEQRTALNSSSLWWVFGGLAFFVVFTGVGFYFARVKRMIENIPTSSPAGVSFGLNEISGEVALIENKQLSSPLTKSSCVWFHYLVKERRGSGKNARWVTVTDDKQGIPFYCRDSEGEIKVDPDGAELLTKHDHHETKGDRRYSEWLLKPEDKLYALGQALVDSEQTDRLVFAKPTEKLAGTPSNLFILSNYPEKDIMIKKAISAMFYLAIAMVGMLASCIFYLGMQGDFSATDYLLAATVAPLFLTFFTLVLHYNDLVFLRQRVKRNWANIQVSLKKRADLVPPLLSVVKGYQKHEQELNNHFTRLRQIAKATIETTEQAGEVVVESRRLAQGMKLLVEEYPELKANDLMMSFFSTLTQLENEIALMRQGYNDSVMVYNTRIQTIPDVLFAGIFGFRRHQLWQNI